MTLFDLSLHDLKKLFYIFAVVFSDRNKLYLIMRQEQIHDLHQRLKLNIKVKSWDKKY